LARGVGKPDAGSAWSVSCIGAGALDVEHSESVNLLLQAAAAILMAGLQAPENPRRQNRAWCARKQRKKCCWYAATSTVRRPFEPDAGTGDRSRRFLSGHGLEKQWTLPTVRWNTHAPIISTKCCIVDTAGRLAIDAAMMQESQELHASPESI